MWLRLATISMFTRSVVLTLLCATVVAVVTLGMDLYVGDWGSEPPTWRQPSGWLGVITVSVIMGFLGGLAGEFQKDKFLDALTGVDPADYRKVARAVERGPIPEDPVIRRAAARLAAIYAHSERKSRRSSVLVNVGVVVIQASVILHWGGRMWLYTLLIPLLLTIEFSALAMRAWLRLPLLEARLQLLERAEQPVASVLA